MQFEVATVRSEGRVKPRHLLWAGKVIGVLYVAETYDQTHLRTLRTARICEATRMQDLVPPLLDATLISCKPDWWVIAGWERISTGYDDRMIDYAQAWLLVPAGPAVTQPKRS